MNDVYLEWNSDFILTSNGSIYFGTVWDRIRQRIVRSLLTNPAIELTFAGTTAPDYIYEPDYGLGMGKLVDRNMTPEQIAQLRQAIIQAVMQDSAVDPGVLPTITINANNTDLVEIVIKVMLANGQGGTITLQAY